MMRRLVGLVLLVAGYAAGRHAVDASAGSHPILRAGHVTLNAANHTNTGLLAFGAVMFVTGVMLTFAGGGDRS